MTHGPIIVVEDDPFTRLIPIILDPKSPADRQQAFADFMAHDEGDFEGWVGKVRSRAGHLYPAEVRLVSSVDDMKANLKNCHALVVESFPVESSDVDVAKRLVVIQKFGVGLRNIDTAACAEKGVKLLTLRRRANVACAEHVFALMLALGRKINQFDGVISAEHLQAAGHTFRPFNRKHTPGGNFGRLGGLRMLNESTLGIIGLGEIGRELALRARPFGMRVVYHQRTRHSPAEEQELSAEYASLDHLLQTSDWIVPQLPGGPATRNFLGSRELSQVKNGACIVNVANPEIIDRSALVEALRSGRLGGFGLDTPYEEPGRSDDELLKFPNVIITPHLAGSPRSNGLQDFEDLIENLAREMTQ